MEGLGLIGMNILILGASGFIGSWVTKELLDQGFRVTGVVRPNARGKWRIDSVASQYPAFSVIQALELTASGLTPILQSAPRYHALINCVGDGIDPQRQSWPDLWKANVDVNCEAAEVASALTIPRMIVAGSGFEYGFSESDQKFDENTPLKPTTPYAASKVAGFYAIKEKCQAYDICLDYLRVFGAVGAGDNPHRLLQSTIQTLLRGEPLNLTDGYQVRDFVAVDDVARAFVDILKWEQPHRAEVFNVATAHGKTVREFVIAICRHMGASESLLNWGARPNRQSEGRYWIGDNEKIRQMIGWSPRIDWQTVVQEACHFYLQKSKDFAP